MKYLDILEYPDIDVPAGRATFVTGESGSGKSTLLRLFNGVLSPSAGTLACEGKDLAEWDILELRRQVLLVGQSVYLFDGTIKSNFTEFYGYRGLPAPGDAAMRGHLELCCADFSLDADCLTLSGGERQRVYLAIFLSFGPRVLMLDEPTSALDAETAATLMHNLRTWHQGRGATLLAVSHDAALVEAFADHHVRLESPAAAAQNGPAAHGEVM